jgi:AbrB family looped-hinge helix DNA binding protein
VDVFALRLDKHGRILIPVAIRRRLNLHAGSRLLVKVENGALRMETREHTLERIRARLRNFIPENRNLSEELLAERREEAAREDAT